MQEQMQKKCRKNAEKMQHPVRHLEGRVTGKRKQHAATYGWLASASNMRAGNRRVRGKELRNAERIQTAEQTQ
jgi:hypothetical protein